MKKWKEFLIAMSLSFLFLFGLIMCRTEVGSTPAETSTEKIALSWESKNVSNKQWSNYVFELIEKELWPVYSTVTDGKRFCTKYDSLNKSQKINLFGEIISQMALYESSWEPQTSSVDVGNVGNKDTWSVGLLQVSVTDQWGELKDLGYKFDDLLKPIPNLHLSMKVLERQIKSRGKFILQNSDSLRYWAVLLEGNKYSKVDKITAATQKLPFCN